MIKYYGFIVAFIIGGSLNGMERVVKERESKKYYDGSSIVEIFLSEAAFTHAKDEKPILATSACATCVAVGGYDTINKMAFLIHFATAQEVVCCGKNLINYIKPLLTKKLTAETPIKVHLRGGEAGKSENAVIAIKWWMFSDPEVPMTLGSEEILQYKPEGYSLLIDSRSGDVKNYNSQLNPKPRQYTESDMQQAVLSLRVPCIRVLYAARNHD